MRTSSNDRNPTSVEKRYSEFEKFNKEMKRTFPDVMKDITFPRKQLSGNFSPKTIAERSRAFEQYLGYLVMNTTIRMSTLFAPFIYSNEWDRVCKLMLTKQYSMAIVVLRKVLDIQRKLVSDVHPSTVRSYCVLTVCYTHCGNDKQAYLCSRLAIKSIQVDTGNPYLLPLLELCVRLSWKLGEDKEQLEERLKRVVANRDQSETKPSLEDLVMKEVTNSVS